MPIDNGRLPDMGFEAARWTGGEITPEIVILHDTASRLTKGAAARYLRDNDAKVSVHFVVERDGSVEQQVPVNRRANHAGRSNWHGRSGCNGFSLGIEIVNPGRMARGTKGQARAWWGETFDIDQYGIEAIETPQHGAGLWMPYPEAQIGAVLVLLNTLFGRVEKLRDITTHWYVSPGRKVDVNPLFPLEHVRALVLGRDDPAEQAAQAASEATAGDEYVMIDAPGDALNLRRWPSFNPNIIAAIHDGTVVPVLRSGIFDGRRWLRVHHGGSEGWIVARYTAPILHQGAGQ